jgi:hypothetical protein
VDMLLDATIRSIKDKTLDSREERITKDCVSIITHVYVEGEWLRVSNYGLYSLDYTVGGLIGLHVVVKEVSVLDLSGRVVDSKFKNVH